jgi:exosortase A-associated hydrolase 2
MQSASVAQRSPLLEASAAETPFFLSSAEARLFAFLHEPEGRAKSLAFVMSHPFAEEKLWSHRVFVGVARDLAARGWPVLRFDYRGAGDSSGRTAETSLETHLADLAAAVAALRRRLPRIERIGLVGLRLGGSVAALLAERSLADPSLAPLRAAPLVLWEPIVNGEAYFQELLRSNLATQLAVYGKVHDNREVLLQRIRDGGSVNVDGYEIGKALIDSCARTDLLPMGPKSHLGPTLVVQIAPTAEQKPRPELQALVASYQSGELGTVVEQPFWREIKAFYGDARSLGTFTTAWLEKVS